MVYLRSVLIVDKPKFTDHPFRNARKGLRYAVFPCSIRNLFLPHPHYVPALPACSPPDRDTFAVQLLSTPPSLYYSHNISRCSSLEPHISQLPYSKASSSWMCRWRFIFSPVVCIHNISKAVGVGELGSRHLFS